IGIDALRVVESLAPLRPGVEPIRIIQDKTLQKPWLAENGFPVGPFRMVRSEAELREAVAALGGDVFVKTGRGGYDARGQVRIGAVEPETPCPVSKSRPGDASRGPGFGEAWRELGERPAVVEMALDLACEISVMAARNPAGEVRAFPVARNHHENQILAWSVLPAGVGPDLEARAEALAADLV